jgi:hypothetical protein
MATRALTPVAQRRSRVNVSARRALGRRRDWQQVLLSQDAGAIWQELSIQVRTAIPDHAGGYEQLTQELFLHLLATDRVSVYIDRNLSDSEITKDIVSILCE